MRGRGSRGFGSFRQRAAVTKNHFELTMSTTGGTELQTSVAEGIDAPNDRGIDVPENSTLRSVKVFLNATTTVTGKHQCLLYYRPGATAIAAPIASFFATTDPATEEMIQIRQLARGTVRTHHIVTGAVEPLKFSCIWRGAQHMYDSDSMVVALLDGTSTVYDVQVWLTFTR